MISCVCVGSLYKLCRYIISKALNRFRERNYRYLAWNKNKSRNFIQILFDLIILNIMLWSFSMWAAGTLTRQCPTSPNIVSWQLLLRSLECSENQLPVPHCPESNTFVAYFAYLAYSIFSLIWHGWRGGLVKYVQSSHGLPDLFIANW